MYYKIEVYSKNNVSDIYFESYLFAYDGKYPLDENTNGKLNRLKEINAKKDYEVRLTAIMLESGVAYNSTIAENRVQAVIYITGNFDTK